MSYNEFWTQKTLSYHIFQVAVGFSIWYENIQWRRKCWYDLDNDLKTSRVWIMNEKKKHIWNVNSKLVSKLFIWKSHATAQNVWLIGLISYFNLIAVIGKCVRVFLASKGPAYVYCFFTHRVVAKAIGRHSYSTCQLWKKKN